MSIVNTLSLESNRQIKINFDGGDLSSDADLLLSKNFYTSILIRSHASIKGKKVGRITAHYGFRRSWITFCIWYQSSFFSHPRDLFTAKFPWSI